MENCAFSLRIEGEGVFSALHVIPRGQGGIFSRLHSILTKPKTWAEPKEINGANYSVIYAETDSSGQPDWRKVEYLAKDWSRWVVLPQALQDSLPTGSTLRVFNGEQFAADMLLHTACELIRQTRMPMYRRALGILDPQGNNAHMLYTLLKHYTLIKVVTNNLPLYEDAAEQMMDELGAPVLLSNQLSFLSDCVLVLAPEAFSSQEDVRLHCPVLCHSESSLKLQYRCDTLTQPLPALPKGGECPEQIDPALFAGALYTFCQGDVVQPVASTLLYSGVTVNMQQAATILLQKSGIKL